MEKSKIFAEGNLNLPPGCNVSYYIVEKDKNFLRWLDKLLVEVLDFNLGEESASVVVKNVEDKDGVIVGREVYGNEIDKMIDLHEKYEDRGNSNRVDVFYGKSRVFLTLIKSKYAREKMGKFLLETREWVKVEEVPAKKMPGYVGKMLRSYP